MEPVYFVLAIMGCADGNNRCAEARLDPARYATVQQCQAAMPAALARNTDLSFPVISAACRSSNVQMVGRAAAKPAG